jgi:Zn-dependent protease
MTRTPTSDHPPAPASKDPHPGGLNRGRRLSGLTVRLTAGGYVLAIVALLVSGITLPAAAPGRPAAAYLAAAAALAALLLGSLILHEVGHAISVRRHGGRVGEIRVGLFGATAHGTDTGHTTASGMTATSNYARHSGQAEPGGYARDDGQGTIAGQAAALASPGAQWRVAAAGPAASLGLAVLTGGIAVGVAALGTDRLAVVVLAVAALGNAVLGILSLLPGAGADGGRIVRALTAARTGDPAKAGVVAARTGQVTGAVLIAAGLAVVLLGYAAGLWLALIGILAFVTSRSEARQLLTTAALTGLRNGDVVSLRPAAEAGVPSWQTVESFLADQGRLGQPGFGPTAFPLVDFGGQAAGLLTVSQLAAVPAERHDTVRLRDVGTPLGHVVTTTADEPVASLLGRLSVWPRVPAAAHTAGHALVLDPEGMPVGVLTPADLSRATQLGQLRQRTQSFSGVS